MLLLDEENKSNGWVSVMKECLEFLSRWTQYQLTRERAAAAADGTHSSVHALSEHDTLFPETLTSHALAGVAGGNCHVCFDSTQVLNIASQRYT